MSRRAALVCVLAGVLVGSVTAAAGPTASPVRPDSRSAAIPAPASAKHRLDNAPFPVPPSAAQCRNDYHLTCYTPMQIRAAYGVDPLLRLHNDGAGQTIAIVDSFGSPTIEHDLRVFDQTWGLPDPPSIRTITPGGALPPFDPADGDMTGWAFETTLDVQYAHLVAPRAAILVVATPVAETEGVVGFPEIVQAENYVVDNGLADVISQSLGAAEPTFPSTERLLSLRSAFVNAARHGVTVVASSGDSGATDYQNDAQTLYDYPVDSWPSTDPLVTSVGGTRLHLSESGRRIAPDSAWSDEYGAGGGGLSTVFSRPAFQSSVRGVVGEYRGTPDIALSAAVDGGVLVYTSYDSTDTGWAIVGGTSEAAPLFAGMVALAAQRAHHRLGVINSALYRLAAKPGNGIIDVTVGDNSYGDVTGYSAAPGYDLASGLGTVNAARFVPALAKAVTPTKWPKP
jgi:subtilase family serine protease